jgi:N-acetylmuramoyl-L-alanine amidase
VRERLSQIRIWIWLFCIFVTAAAVQAQEYLSVSPSQSDGVYTLLKRYNLTPSREMISRFWALNSDLVRGGEYLRLGFEYRLPIYKFYYDGTSIRTSLGSSDLELAKKIEQYNNGLFKAGLQSAPFRTSREFWVPAHWLPESKAAAEPASFAIFGPQYQSVQLQDEVLKGTVIYLDPGHGGPDPGAMGLRGRDRLYEDEYAYDITLRLAHRLLEHGASVYMLVQDEDDGIRDEAILKYDDHEYYLGHVPIARDQLRRLSDRVDIVNNLYDRYKKRAKNQLMVTIHLDSRSQGQRIDIFYYHQANNAQSKKLASTLRDKVDEKYALNQPGRGYSGTISTRDLHVLSQAKPTAVYIELGNIKNKKDQDRFIIADNRQAVANWLCEGLIDFIQ